MTTQIFPQKIRLTEIEARFSEDWTFDKIVSGGAVYNYGRRSELFTHGQIVSGDSGDEMWALSVVI